MIQKEECSSTLDTINLDSQGKVGMCFPTVFCSCYNVLVFFIVFLSFIYEGCPQTFFFSKLENVLKVQKAENPCTKRWAESEQLICETVKTVDSPSPFFFLFVIQSMCTAFRCLTGCDSSQCTSTHPKIQKEQWNLNTEAP